MGKLVLRVQKPVLKAGKLVLRLGSHFSEWEVCSECTCSRSGEAFFEGGETCSEGGEACSEGGETCSGGGEPGGGDLF